LGASISHTDSWGYVPVLDATLLDSHDALKFLLSQGLDLSVKLFDGKNLLHIAAMNSDLKTIEILMEADIGSVDPYGLDNSGSTPLQYLRQREDGADLLEAFGALVLKTESSYTANDAKASTLAPESTAPDPMDEEVEDLFFDAVDSLEDPLLA
jgi:Ankyrin repeats (3 copies)